MGISGLLPLLAPATRTVHLRDLAGTRIGIDAYVWLHKGAFGCALELHLNRAAADGYVTYCMKRIDLLKKHNIVPVVVFDGGCLPMKRGTELERRRKRDAYKARAVEELDKGNRTKALELFQSCLDVTPWMAHNLIKVLRERNIEFVVAPYEADAQLAYLDKIGYVNAVLTEDSDLVVFGCRRVILKLDAQGGAVEVNADELGKIPDFKGWTFEKFRQACILSGCDYVPSLKGIGLKKAIEAIGRHGSIDNALRYWQKWGKAVKAPAIRRGYEHEVRMAEKTFLHQRVYDPLQRKLVPLNPIEDGNDVRALYFIGPDMTPEVAQDIAEGRLNPFTKNVFGDEDEDDGWVFEQFELEMDKENGYEPIIPKHLTSAAPEDFNFWDLLPSDSGSSSASASASDFLPLPSIQSFAKPTTPRAPLGVLGLNSAFGLGIAFEPPKPPPPPPKLAPPKPFRERVVTSASSQFFSCSTTALVAKSSSPETKPDASREPPPSSVPSKFSIDGDNLPSGDPDIISSSPEPDIVSSCPERLSPEVEDTPQPSHTPPTNSRRRPRVDDPPTSSSEDRENPEESGGAGAGEVSHKRRNVLEAMRGQWSFQDVETLLGHSTRWTKRRSPVAKAKTEHANPPSASQPNPLIIPLQSRSLGPAFRKPPPPPQCPVPDGFDASEWTPARTTTTAPAASRPLSKTAPLQSPRPPHIQSPPAATSSSSLSPAPPWFPLPSGHHHFNRHHHHHHRPDHHGRPPSSSSSSSSSPTPAVLGKIIELEVAQQYGRTLQEKFGADPELFAGVSLGATVEKRRKTLAAATTTVTGGTVARRKR